MIVGDFNGDPLARNRRTFVEKDATLQLQISTVNRAPRWQSHLYLCTTR